MRALGEPELAGDEPDPTTGETKEEPSEDEEEGVLRIDPAKLKELVAEVNITDRDCYADISTKILEHLQEKDNNIERIRFSKACYDSYDDLIIPPELIKVTKQTPPKKRTAFNTSHIKNRPPVPPKPKEEPTEKDRSRSPGASGSKTWRKKETNPLAKEEMKAAKQATKREAHLPENIAAAHFERTFNYVRQSDKCWVCKKEYSVMFCRNCRKQACYECMEISANRRNCQAMYLDPNTATGTPWMTFSSHADFENERQTVKERQPFGWNPEENLKIRQDYLRFLKTQHKHEGSCGIANLDRAFMTVNQKMNIADNTYHTKNNKVPTLEEHLNSQDPEKPLPVQRAEVMVAGWPEDKDMPTSEEQKCLEIYGSWLMGHEKVNIDQRAENECTGVETQRDDYRLRLAVLNVGDLNKKPVMAGRQKFSKETLNNLDLRPLPNLVVNNLAHIVLLNESAGIGTTWNELCQAHQLFQWLAWSEVQKPRAHVSNSSDIFQDPQTDLDGSCTVQFSELFSETNMIQMAQLIHLALVHQSLIQLRSYPRWMMPKETF